MTKQKSMVDIHNKRCLVYNLTAYQTLPFKVNLQNKKLLTGLYCISFMATHLTFWFFSYKRLTFLFVQIFTTFIYLLQLMFLYLAFCPPNIFCCILELLFSQWRNSNSICFIKILLVSFRVFIAFVFLCNIYICLWLRFSLVFPNTCVLRWFGILYSSKT